MKPDNNGLGFSGSSTYAWCTKEMANRYMNFVSLYFKSQQEELHFKIRILRCLRSDDKEARGHKVCITEQS
jgi:hypothetical protein